MKKIKKCCLPLLLILTLLCACGGAASSAASPPQENFTASSDASFGAVQNAAESKTEAGSAAVSPDTGAGGADSRLQTAKLIYTAEFEAETTDFTTAAADLEALVKTAGGYFERSSVNNAGGGRRYGSYVVRLPSVQFHSFCKQVGEQCHVTYQNSREENIGEVYYDTELRLETQKTKLERLQSLLARAERLEDIITLESAISETELTIEQLSGTLRGYDLLVDFSTVNINLNEVYQLSDSGESEPAQGFGARLAAALSGGWQSFTGGLQDLLVALAYSWMWVLLAAAVAVVLLRGLARRRKRDAQPPILHTQGDKPEKK